MHERIRRVMVDEYIGAILIALLILTGFSNLLQMIVGPVVEAMGPPRSEATEILRPRGYGAFELLNNFVFLLVYFGAAAGLGRWLYLKPPLETIADEEQA